MSAFPVSGLQAGRKTQTRRILKDQAAWAGKDAIVKRWPHQKAGLPYAVGDRLYVREAWRATDTFDSYKPRDIPRHNQIFYEATLWPDEIPKRGKLRGPRAMCRWMSRLTLTVTEVRVERLNDISEADAVAEGLVPASGAPLSDGRPGFYTADTDGPGLLPVSAYALLWDTLHGPGAWAQNPFVAAITFTVERCNIDDVTADPPA